MVLAHQHVSVCESSQTQVMWDGLFVCVCAHVLSESVCVRTCFHVHVSGCEDIAHCLEWRWLSWQRPLSSVSAQYPRCPAGQWLSTGTHIDTVSNMQREWFSVPRTKWVVYLGLLYNKNNRINTSACPKIPTNQSQCPVLTAGESPAPQRQPCALPLPGGWSHAIRAASHQRDCRRTQTGDTGESSSSSALF